jgi:hypothetical protein
LIVTPLRPIQSHARNSGIAQETDLASRSQKGAQFPSR